MNELYDILGVSPDADAERIKQAFRRLAREYHPDRNPDDPEAEARFKEALAAFEILSDPEQRRTYDRDGLQGVDSSAPAGVSTGSERPDERGSWEGGDSSFRDVFSDVVDGEGPFDTSHFKDVGGFGRAKRSRAKQAADGSVEGGRDVECDRSVVTTLEVDFLDAVLGREVSVDLDEGTMRLDLKPGTRTGDRLRLRENESSDFLLDIEVRDHPLLRREGLDLYLDLPVTFAEAVDGGDVRVPTPEGDVQVDLPAGVDSGTQLRLTDRGVERKSERGDFYAVVQIVSPDDVGEQLRGAVEALEAGYSRDVRGGLAL